MLPKFSYVRAKSLPEAIRALSAPGARVHAGGTDLLGCLRDGADTAAKLVSIAGIAGLRGMSVPVGGGLRVGSTTTLADVAADGRIKQQYPVLAQAAASAASPQLRYQGTIGGNICQRPRCWYFRGDFACLRKGGATCFAPQGENTYHAVFGGGACFMVHPSDTANALVALGARIRIAGPAGTRTVPAGAFFVLPDKDIRRENVLQPHEIVTDILLPPSDAGMRSAYRKVRTRGAWDFALVSVALVLAVDGAGVVKHARVVLGGAAPVPWRAEAAEQVLLGARLDKDTAARAAEVAVKGAEPLSQNGYKVTQLRGIVEEQLVALI